MLCHNQPHGLSHKVDGDGLLVAGKIEPAQIPGHNIREISDALQHYPRRLLMNSAWG